MATATWNDKVLAESDDIEVVEGNIYFPPDSVNKECLEKSDNQTSCAWKGMASYYSVVVGGETNTDAAWYYPEPSAAAMKIKDYVAFWNGVEVNE